MVWHIRRWNEIYENANTRKIKNLTSVLVPNKHDGKGFRRIAKREDAAEIYAAWILILQVASKSPQRGLLVDDEGELEAVDLADKTGFPEAIFSTALKVLSDKTIGWVESVLPGDCPGMPGDCPALSGLTEPNLTEPNRIEENLPPAGMAADFSFSGNWDSEAWQHALPLYERARKELLPADARPKPKDRDTIGKAALVAVLIYDNRWFLDSLDGINEPEIKKPIAVWKSRLSVRPKSEGRDLRVLMDAMTVPKKGGDDGKAA